MKREIKNCGEYVEVDCDKISSEIEKLSSAQVIVLSKARIELAGEDKKLFIEKFKKIMVDNEDEWKNLSEEQKCDCAIRKILLG